MSRRKILSNATQLAARTLIVMAAAGLVITFVYLPVRWTGTSKKAFEREEAFRQRIPPQYRERADRERQMIRRRHRARLRGRPADAEPVHRHRHLCMDRPQGFQVEIET